MCNLKDRTNYLPTSIKNLKSWGKKPMNTIPKSTVIKKLIKCFSIILYAGFSSPKNIKKKTWGRPSSNILIGKKLWDRLIAWNSFKNMWNLISFSILAKTIREDPSSSSKLGIFYPIKLTTSKFISTITPTSSKSFPKMKWKATSTKWSSSQTTPTSVQPTFNTPLPKNFPRQAITTSPNGSTNWFFSE